MDERADCRVELVDSSGDVAVVEGAGELDFYAAPGFQACVMGAVEGGASHVVVDLTEVAFLDSSALGVLIGAARRSAEKAAELLIVCPPGNVARIIAISGLNRVFATYATRDEALGKDSGGRAM